MTHKLFTQKSEKEKSLNEYLQTRPSNVFKIAKNFTKNNYKIFFKGLIVTLEVFISNFGSMYVLGESGHGWLLLYEFNVSW